MNISRVRQLSFTVVLLAFSAFAYAAGSPGVRVLRLSFAQGDVQIDRNSGDGWEQAINNMPVIGGARLYAAENSKAELEFEDGSSIRLAGPAQITLTELSTASDGSPVNVIQVDSGEIYVNARMHHHDQFRVLTPSGDAFNISKPSHLRFTVDQQTASLAVMDGEAIVQGGEPNAKVHAGESYNYILGQPASAARLNSVPQEPEDAWDEQRNSYNDQNVSAGAAYSGSDDPNAYGVADLGAYGSYSDQPGYGEVWQPSGVGPDWNPYDDGAWSYYPDWGWTFVSGYPWGWAPFFYGDWCYIGGRGWAWRSGPWHGPWHGRGGGGGGGFHPQPRFANHPGNNWNAPHPPAHLTHGTVAVAGSHLSVGPIGQTHAGATSSGFNHGISGGVNRAANGFTGRSGAGSTARGGPVSNLAHGPVVSNVHGISITGQKGSYRVVGQGAGRNGANPGRNGASDLRSASGANRGSSAVRGGHEGYRPSPVSVHGGVPGGYASGGNSAPRTFSAPSTTMRSAPSAPPVSSAPHVSSGGGFSGGGGFHGGGGGGGGFHGGGGGGGGFHGGGGGGHR